MEFEFFDNPYNNKYCLRDTYGIHEINREHLLDVKLKKLEERCKILEENLHSPDKQLNMCLFQNRLQQLSYENNLLKSRNIAFDKPKKVEPFVIVYKSRPIQGIILELWGKNPEYNWEV